MIDRWPFKSHGVESGPARFRLGGGGVALARSWLLGGVAAAVVLAGAATQGVAQERINVVASLPVYAEIAREVGGELAEVTAIADPAEDAHFVRPKPSFAVRIQRADVFITTGLDLELWVPALLDRAGNTRVREGGQGYVTAYTGIELLDIPEAADRAGGDIHVYGNPHVFTDPLNAITVATNIATGLKRVAPRHAARFDANLADFRDRIHQRLFGDELVSLLNGPTLEALARQDKLFPFLRAQSLDGRPLMGRLGGWLAEAEPFRGRRIICYHKNWAYFENRFDVTCADYVEAKPGIPPTPGHVTRLIDMMNNQGINVLLAANYFDRSKITAVTRRANATGVVVPMQPHGVEGVDDYFELVDYWVESLASAFRRTSPDRHPPEDDGS